MNADSSEPMEACDTTSEIFEGPLQGRTRKGGILQMKI